MFDLIHPNVTYLTQPKLPELTLTIKIYPKIPLKWLRPPLPNSK